MLVICLSCKKIFGCINEKGEIIAECLSCKMYQDCLAETPINMVVERRVMFVRFDNGCLSHETPKIGFKQKKI